MSLSCREPVPSVLGDLRFDVGCGKPLPCPDHSSRSTAPLTGGSTPVDENATATSAPSGEG